MNVAADTWIAKRQRLMLSQNERQRRHDKVRQAMRADGIDCLVVCAVGGSWFYEGNVRYFVGDRFKNQSHDEYVVFPVAGDPVFVLTYGFRVHWAKQAWIADVRAPSDPRGKDPRFAGERSRSVSLSGIISEKGYSSSVIGITRDILPAATYEEMTANLPDAKLVDCSSLMLDVRRVKSDEEIALTRESALLADEAFYHCCKTIHEGMLEHELLAEWQYVLRKAGCEKTYDLIVTDPVGPSCLKWPQEPRAFEPGDTVVVEISPCFGGYWTQMNRTFVIGQMNPQLVELTNVCEEAHQAAAEQLVPGNTAGQVARAMESVVKNHGYAPLLRGGHTSIGLDLTELPLHPNDDTLLEPGMIMVLHPSAAVPGYKIGDPGFFGPGDTYLITESGCERLTKSPQSIVVV